MARKKTDYLWEADDQSPPEPEADRPGRPERSEHRAAMLDLKDLANRLAALSRGERRTLPLAEDTLDQLDLLDAADGRVDRRRVLMRAKLLLGREDLVKLDAALAGDTTAAARERELVAWRARIIAGDDAVIQAFIEGYPHADRQAIRTNAREARSAGAGAKAAGDRLLRSLRDAAVVTVSHEE